MNWAALSAALPLSTPLAIPICCWRAPHLKSPPLNCVSSSAMPPRRLPASCPWIPTRSGFPLPAPCLPRRLHPAARLNPPMCNSLSKRPALHQLSIPSANRSFKNPSAPNAPPISPSAAPATKASSFMTAINTDCRWTSPLCRWVAPRQNLPAGNAGPKAEATGYTGLFVQSLSPRRTLSIRRGLHYPPSLNHSPGSLELKLSDIQKRLPPGVFPGAPFDFLHAWPHLSPGRIAAWDTRPVYTSLVSYPSPVWLFRRLIATTAKLSKSFMARVSGQKNVTRYI